LVTPLTDRQSLDVAGLERLIAHVLGGGVHGLFVLGTTGEAAALDDAVRCALVRHTCRVVAGRVPVLVGVTDTRVAESVRMARFAAEVGADAVVVSAPFYLPLEQQELVAYVETIVTHQPLPCFLYNIPALTKTAYELETVRRLAELPGVIGMKDSSGELDYLERLRQLVARPDWSFFVGPEALLADAVQRGIAHGCVGGGANLAPALFVAIYDAAVRGDLERVAALRRGILLLDEVYRLAPGTSSIIRGLKCGLSILGICRDVMGEPLRASTASERRSIEGKVEELRGIISALPAAAPQTTAAPHAMTAGRELERDGGGRPKPARPPRLVAR
jgi:4-hydroxy-tetrahydrodipicolinate synthase